MMILFALFIGVLVGCCIFYLWPSGSLSEEIVQIKYDNENLLSQREWSVCKGCNIVAPNTLHAHVILNDARLRSIVNDVIGNSGYCTSCEDDPFFNTSKRKTI